MLPPGAAHITTGSIAIAGIVIASIALMLIRPRGIAEVFWIGGGVALLLVTGLLPLHVAAHATASGSDVYLFLIGMMLLAELAQAHGVFDWLSSVAVRSARGSGVRLFTVVYAVGTAVTILLSNDATAVVLTPAILAAVRRARAEPVPCLFACAMIANAASFVLPISNPANLVVFGHGMPTLGHWLAAFAVPSLLSIAITYAVLRVVFRRQLAVAIEQAAESAPLGAMGRTVLVGLGVVVAVLLTASSLGWQLGLPTCVAALAVTAVVSLASRRSPWPLATHISWATIALVAGLFIMVAAVESIGVLSATAGALRWADQGSRVPSMLLTSFTVAIANNLVNNLPLGLVASGTLHAVHATSLTQTAVLLGVDLGPNLSVTGSLATILWLLALRRGQVQVSAASFLRVGLVAMPAALLGAATAAICMGLLTGAQ